MIAEAKLSYSTGNTQEAAPMAKNRPLQDELDKSHEALPAMLLQAMVKEKLKASGIKLRKTALKRLVEQMLDGDLDTIEIDDDDLKASNKADELTTLSFGKDDMEELERRTQRFLDQMPDMIERLAKQNAKRMVQLSRKQWHEDYGLRQAEKVAFSERLRFRWRKGLVPLNLLVEIAREYAEERWEEEHDATNDDGLSPRLDALFGLQRRGCQVSAEIVTLLEAGFADGAMARWRTLFEIAVIADILHGADDATAERYLDHSDVDAKRAADRYMETNPNAPSNPIPVEEMAELTVRMEALEKKYGKAFKTPYGWAAELTGQANPNFMTLVERADRTSNTSVYKMASFNVHANARSLFFRHTNMVTHAGVIAGASNSGLEDPGANTAYAIGQLTALLLPEPLDAIDDLVMLHMVIRLREAAEKGFYKAAEKLHAEDVEQAVLMQHDFSDISVVDIEDFPTADNIDD